jgi:hypothetical protein
VDPNQSVVLVQIANNFHLHDVLTPTPPIAQYATDTNMRKVEGPADRLDGLPDWIRSRFRIDRHLIGQKNVKKSRMLIEQRAAFWVA